MKLLPLLLLVLYSLTATGQSITVSGRIRDAKAGEPLLFAYCTDTISKTNAATNGDGFFTMRLKKGEAFLVATYIGYDNAAQKYNFRNDTTIVIELKKSRRARRSCSKRLYAC